MSTSVDLVDILLKLRQERVLFTNQYTSKVERTHWSNEVEIFGTVSVSSSLLFKVKWWTDSWCCRSMLWPHSLTPSAQQVWRYFLTRDRVFTASIVWKFFRLLYIQTAKCLLCIWVPSSRFKSWCMKICSLLLRSQKIDFKGAFLL